MKRPITRQLRRNAFSLLELLAVVTLIGIISAIIVPRISGQAFDAKRKVCHQYKADINTALDRWWFDKGSWATSLSDIEHIDYHPEAIPNCPVDNTPYVIDGTTHRVLGHAH